MDNPTTVYIHWEQRRVLENILAIRRQLGEEISFADLVYQYQQKKRHQDIVAGLICLSNSL